MGVQTAKQDSCCTRKELIARVRKVIDDMDKVKIESRCCCTDPENPPPDTKVVSTACLDGKEGLPQIVKQSKEKYLWIPPKMDNRPPLDPTMSCYAATVANRFYDQYKGCKLDCVPHSENGAAPPHSHWWNKPQPAQNGSPGGQGPDYCEDPNFQPPEPEGHMAWTNEPGGTCKHPEYCKAHCFDHVPFRDWSRN